MELTIGINRALHNNPALAIAVGKWLTYNSSIMTENSKQLYAVGQIGISNENFYHSGGWQDECTISDEYEFPVDLLAMYDEELEKLS